MGRRKSVSVLILALLLTSALALALSPRANTISVLSVTISSPSPGTVFSRGQTVTLTASVSSDGSPVSGASVATNGPGGAVIKLPETSTQGTYSAQYTVQATDPAGTWTINMVAEKNGLFALAVTHVSISGLIEISILSPSSGSKFSTGESVTVRAVLTFQDGTVLPPSASVNINGLPSGLVPMSVDPSDPSHKTWTGTHTITGSDVPFDGITWNLVVSASVGANAGSSAPTIVFLFNSLNVLVSTWSSSSFTTPKDSFAKGDTVFVEAQVALRDGTVVSSATVNFEITGTSVANSPVSMTFSASLHAWVGSYSILQTDGTGNQVISVSATDTTGHGGFGTHVMGIEAPAPVSALQPLEATITFDPQAHELVVKAVCNLGCTGPTTVTVTSAPQQNQGEGDDEGDDDHGNGVQRSYTVADSAGHVLVLQILVKIEGNELKAHLESIQYGSSAPIHVHDNEISFEFPQSGNLEQRISVSDLVNTEAHFDARNDMTSIHSGTQGGDDNEDDEGQNVTPKNGLWLLSLVTSNGSLSVNFFQAG